MKNAFQELYSGDLHRYAGCLPLDVRMIHYYLRKAHTAKGFLVKKYYRFIYKCIVRRYHIELSCDSQIGKGLYIGHHSGITVNRDAVLGENVNIHKGVTIGQENRGPREGVPTIGNCVWIGVNATIVGNIKIGNDVLIAPNSYVNCNVPDHSVVFGNPCVIKHRENATEGYINHTV